ncbi:MAG: T9SS type A sorting domain-containing protein, partial [Bacteroidia bacterium]
YSVTVTDANNCSASDAINVTINALPVVNLGADITQCGGTVMLDAQNAGSSYQWNNSTNAQTLTATSSGTYSVTVTDANNCSASDAIDIVIHNLPAVTLTLAQDTFCNNGNTFVLSGGLPAGGSYSGPGVSNTIYDPFISGNGLHSIVYTYTDSNNCSSVATQTIYTDICNGVSEPVAAVFGLYPNPAQGNTQFVLTQPLAVPGLIEVFGTDGRVVYQLQLNAGMQVVLLQTEVLSEGIYLVRLTAGNMQTVQRLIAE